LLPVRSRSESKIKSKEQEQDYQKKFYGLKKVSGGDQIGSG